MLSYCSPRVSECSLFKYALIKIYTKIFGKEPKKCSSVSETICYLLLLSLGLRWLEREYDYHNLVLRLYHNYVEHYSLLEIILKYKTFRQLTITYSCFSRLVLCFLTVIFSSPTPSFCTIPPFILLLSFGVSSFTSSSSPFSA